MVLLGLGYKDYNKIDTRYEISFIGALIAFIYNTTDDRHLYYKVMSELEQILSLKEFGINIDWNIKGKNGISLFDDAIKHKNEGIMSLLLKYDTSLNLSPNDYQKYRELAEDGFTATLLINYFTNRGHSRDTINNLIKKCGFLHMRLGDDNIIRLLFPDECYAEYGNSWIDTTIDDINSNQIHKDDLLGIVGNVQTSCGGVQLHNCNKIYDSNINYEYMFDRLSFNGKRMTNFQPQLRTNNFNRSRQKFWYCFVENDKKYGNCIVLLNSHQWQYDVFCLDNNKWLFSNIYPYPRLNSIMFSDDDNATDNIKFEMSNHGNAFHLIRSFLFDSGMHIYMELYINKYQLFLQL